jgi:NAD(P)-dependent dehydrogenase (short-subunit alcohol dehydrogenase family)
VTTAIEKFKNFCTFYFLFAYEASKSGVNPFTSSKAGVESLTKTLALELADTGIRVNGIARVL